VGASVIVEQTYNSGMIANILLNDSMRSVTTEDGATIENILPNVFKDIWLSIVVNGCVIGVCCIEAKTSLSCYIHLRIIKKHRPKNKDGAAKKIEEWLINNTKYKLVVGEIPKTHTNVIDFMKKVGFIEVGTLASAWAFNGEAVDLIILSKRV
jgi:hypothetical protein